MFGLPVDILCPWEPHVWVAKLISFVDSTCTPEKHCQIGGEFHDDRMNEMQQIKEVGTGLKAVEGKLVGQDHPLLSYGSVAARMDRLIFTPDVGLEGNRHRKTEVPMSHSTSAQWRLCLRCCRKSLLPLEGRTSSSTLKPLLGDRRVGFSAALRCQNRASISKHCGWTSAFWKDLCWWFEGFSVSAPEREIEGRYSLISLLNWPSNGGFGPGFSCNGSAICGKFRRENEDSPVKMQLTYPLVISHSYETWPSRNFWSLPMKMVICGCLPEDLFLDQNPHASCAELILWCRAAFYPVPPRWVDGEFLLTIYSLNLTNTLANKKRLV